jgi:ferritin-like metal-binding protein YciE
MKKQLTTQANTLSIIAVDAASEIDQSAVQGLRELFENELQEMYWVEKSLTKAFPKMITNALTPELINAVSDHLEITFGHARRLEKIFAMLDMKVELKKSEPIAALINSLQNTIENTDEGVIRDASIVVIAKKIEHFEIASYDTLCTFGELLGEYEVVSILRNTLNEEKEADDALASIAVSSISLQADYDYYGYRSGKRKTA